VGSVCSKFKKEFPGLFAKWSKDKAWKETVQTKFAAGMVTGNREELLGFVRMLVQDGNIPMPKKGAFWSDPDVGQPKAQAELGADGQVLADTGLGKIARVTDWKLNLAKVKPQGMDDEKFAAQQAPKLLFWGAISAVYAEGLRGDVHVWIPKGLTVSSIFWNDELPALWESKRKSRINELCFHVYDRSQNWIAVSFDELLIEEAYMSDAEGLNKGAQSLLQDRDVPAARPNPNKMLITLDRPIKVGELRSRLDAALRQVRRKRRLGIIREYLRNAGVDEGEK